MAPGRHSRQHRGCAALEALVVLAVGAAAVPLQPEAPERLSGSPSSTVREGLTETEATSLAADDQCHAGADDSDCAFSALQLHRRALVSEAAFKEADHGQSEALADEASAADSAWAWPWGAGVGGERCCLCSSGEAGWSASGDCTFCRDEVAHRAGVKDDCQRKNPAFIGSRNCDDKCVHIYQRKTLKGGVGLLDGTDESSTQEGDHLFPDFTFGPFSQASWWPHLGKFGSVEQCCKCTNGSIGWSASGTCSFCRGEVKMTSTVASDCQVGNPSFMGGAECTKSCKVALELKEEEEQAASHTAEDAPPAAQLQLRSAEEQSAESNIEESHVHVIEEVRQGREDGQPGLEGRQGLVAS